MSIKGFDVFVYLFIIVSIIFVSCYLCNKHMSTNRGNFINLPSWKKATRAVFDIMLSSSIIGFFIYNKLLFQLLIAIVAPLLIIFVVILFYIIQNKTASRKSTQSILKSANIDVSEHGLNILVLEYVIYGIRYISKMISYCLIIINGSHEIIKKVITMPNQENSSFFDIMLYFNNIINNRFSSYLIAICAVCMFFSSVFLTVFSITQEKENTSVLSPQRFSDIRRKFHFKEHSI